MIPEGLQVLKSRAADVEAERIAVANEDAEKWWQHLCAVAEKSLGELWQYVCTNRPDGFAANAYEHGFEIRLPGHRKIYAHFSGREAGVNGAPADWWRSYYHGMITDVADGVAWWMVDSPGRKLASYHQTLGSALLAAEV